MRKSTIDLPNETAVRASASRSDVGSEARKSNNQLRSGNRAIGVALMLMAVLLSTGALYSSFSDRFFGLSLSPVRIVLDGSPLPDHQGTYHASRQVTIRNSSSRPVRVVGASPTCSCIQLGDHPDSISPGENISIRWNVVYRAKTPSQKISVFTDHPTYPRLVQELVVSPGLDEGDK